MLPITELKMLSKLELARLLERCATVMSAAYQETLNKDLRLTAYDAQVASGLLCFEHSLTHNNLTLH